MSAEELGRKLRSEVEETTLDHLLFSILRPKANPYASFLTDLDPLDRLLSQFANLPWPPASSHHEPATISINPTGRKITPPILEITAPGPGHGRTSLIYLLAAAAALPTDNDIALGQNTALVIIDANGRFSVPRLVQVMRRRIATCRAAQTEHSPDHNNPIPNQVQDRPALQPQVPSDNDLIERALQHIHIFSPQSFDSLLSTLHALPTYLFSPSNPSAQKVLSGIYITDATAFHWAQKSRLEDLLATTLIATSRTTPSRPSLQTLLSTAMRDATRDLRTAMLELNTSLCARIVFAATERIELGATVRLRIQRRAVRGFPPGTSAGEAWRDARERNAAVGIGRFDVEVSAVGAAAGPGNGSEAGAGGRGEFGIRISGDGVDLLGDEG